MRTCATSSGVLAGLIVSGISRTRSVTRWTRLSMPASVAGGLPAVIWEATRAAGSNGRLAWSGLGRAFQAVAAVWMRLFQPWMGSMLESCLSASSRTLRAQSSALVSRLLAGMVIASHPPGW